MIVSVTSISQMKKVHITYVYVEETILEKDKFSGKIFYNPYFCGDFFISGNLNNTKCYPFFKMVKFSGKIFWKVDFN